MRVKVQADFANEDGIFRPGQFAEFRDAVAHEYIKNKWVIDPEGLVVLSSDGKLTVKRKAEPLVVEVQPIEVVETAALEGAPERAVGRRQRRGTSNQ